MGSLTKSVIQPQWQAWIGIFVMTNKKYGKFMSVSAHYLRKQCLLRLWKLWKKQTENTKSEHFVDLVLLQCHTLCSHNSSLQPMVVCSLMNSASGNKICLALRINTLWVVVSNYPYRTFTWPALRGSELVIKKYGAVLREEIDTIPGVNLISI